MKNRTGMFVLAVALAVPQALLWADNAGTAAPATPTTQTVKSAHKGHRHHKKMKAADASSMPASNPSPAK